ncbi:MAG: insulinase family protein, partial [Selenomonadales bacterium]|nr:insulinase family protein [Selenomonadales bacterium]
NGDIIFASYRDPNLKNTVDVFDETPGFLKDFDADSREMTKYIIGTISSLDSPLTPRYKGLRSQLRWISSASREKLQKHRDEVLAANPEDIRKLASVIEAAMKENCLCVFGNENVINDNAGLFEKVIPVMG